MTMRACMAGSKGQQPSPSRLGCLYPFGQRTPAADQSFGVDDPVNSAWCRGRLGGVLGSVGAGARYGRFRWPSCPRSSRGLDRSTVVVPPPGAPGGGRGGGSGPRSPRVVGSRRNARRAQSQPRASRVEWTPGHRPIRRRSAHLNCDWRTSVATAATTSELPNTHENQGYKRVDRLLGRAGSSSRLP